MAFRSFLSALVGAIVLLTGVGSAPSPARAHSALPAQSEVIPFLRAEVEDTPDGHHRIAWSAPRRAGAVRILASPTDGRANDWREVGVGPSAGEVLTAPLPQADRWWFRLRPARGAALDLADRSLHLASAPNFRDVGGYRTANGQWVRMGVLFRSDGLERLSDADLAKVSRIAPGVVADLRTAGERVRGPDRLPPGATPLVADVAADAGPLPRPGDLKDADAADAFLLNATRGFVSLPSANAAYASLFSAIAVPGRPLVYHCSAGKDRTGWASAVLLTLLGVPKAVVYDDYLASNAYLAAKNEAILASQPPQTARALAPVLTVRGAYLDAAFQETVLRYGGFDAYIARGLGLTAADIARLRARLLVGAPATPSPGPAARLRLDHSATSGRMASAPPRRPMSRASADGRSLRHTFA